MPDESLDARGMAPGERSNRVRKAFDALEPGNELAVVIDIDPQPLYYELRADFDVEEGRSEIERRENDLYVAWLVKSPR